MMIYNNNNNNNNNNNYLYVDQLNLYSIVYDKGAKTKKLSTFP